jgi:F-type H+-transporting ATPase subunit delta
MGAVARRYAKALFEVAKERDQLNTIEDEIHHLNRLFEENESFLTFLKHPTIDHRTKKEAFKRIFSGRISETMLTFINILIERDREAELDDITAYYVRMANAERGLEDALVRTALPLSEAEKANISEQFTRLINKTIRVHNVVDPSVLGGLSVQIGDRVYDGSIKGKLNRFKHRMLRSKS